MAIIRPSADLRNHYKEISEICKKTKSPVYITVNGKEDTAIVSVSLIDELYETIRLMEELNRGLSDIQNQRVISLDEARKKLS